MKKLIFTFFALSTLLLSCGESGTTNSDVKPVDVMVEDWLDILTDDFLKGEKSFEALIDIQESAANVGELTTKADEVIESMNTLVAKTSSYTVAGADAKKLTKVAENYKTKNNDYFNAIVNYCNVVKENADLLLTKNWSDAEDAKFEKIVLPIEDKVYFAADASDEADSDFVEALDNL